MYISEICASGFRCFSEKNPLKIKLQQGLNILVGPNDAGKSAIIDSIRYVLLTRGDDYLRLDANDFHIKTNGERENKLFIRCTFDDLNSDEKSRFLEWCTNENGILRLHICLQATLKKGLTPITQYRAGKNADGLHLDGELKEYLKATYLKPLRDAEKELGAGRRSRLSRILGALPEMAQQSKKAQSEDQKTLTDILNDADSRIESNEAVHKIQNSINVGYLKPLSFADEYLRANLGLGVKGSFEQLLERLELYLLPSNGHTEKITRGLGYNNLLFMAAELLLLQSHPDQISLLLIEEPEAHLHPQHQSLFIEILEKKSKLLNAVQVLLTTHSPHLAAGANLENMAMVTNHKVYSLKSDETKLASDDYEFLRRFLDSTKANLFFARGLIIVEGTSENILLPAIARKIGKPLSKHGVSIVNVGHRGLFHYSRILQRSDGTKMPIPVALIPDRDIPPDIAKELVGERSTESELEIMKKQRHLEDLKKHEGGCVKTFPSDVWTLEFDLARHPKFAVLMNQALLTAKEKRGKTREVLMQEAAQEVETWKTYMNSDEIALRIYTPIYGEQVSKVVLAEQLARIIDELTDNAETFKAKLPQYLIDAINYATQLAPCEPKVDYSPRNTNSVVPEL